MKRRTRVMLSVLLIAFFAIILLPETPAVEEKSLDEKYRPFLYAELPDDMFSPDALCWNAATRTLYLTVPNFNLDPNSGLPQAAPCLAKVNENGTVEKLLDFPQLDGVKHTGCMGMEFGPDGHLYVCDNQYFFDVNNKSRLLRVVFAQGKPTGEVQVVVNGFKVANAIVWDGDRVFVTDTILDEKGKYGSGGIRLFTAQELLSAGTDAAHPAIELDPEHDAHLILTADAKDVRGNNCGADGLTKDQNEVYYFGNYGDGAMYRFRFDNNSKPVMQQIHEGGDLFRCVDGICYDADTNKVYITDSADNSIWAFTPPAWGEEVVFERLWENEDTDGSGGLLDLPCECRAVNGLLIIVNQDVGIGTTGKNTTVDKPYSLSAIKISDDRSFTSTLDGSEQRYIELLPDTFRREDVHDLIFVLHGHGSDRQQIYLDRPELNSVRNCAKENDMILICPDYRAKTSWMGPTAESDLLQIIEESRREYKINRIILAGGSMGGTSVLTFGALHPELVDGIVSFNGHANHLEYENFQDAIAASFGGTKQEIPEEYKKRSAEYFPERLTTMPIAFCLGGRDECVPPFSTQRLANILQKLQPNILLIWQPEGGHSTNEQDCRTALDFVLERSTPKH
ncbi:MAG: alpha/beta fold hydrolase [Planctomycetia bacterium]|nr:alpha/beta fold hydrolase [Planctomycetia bacterium]